MKVVKKTCELVNTLGSWESGAPREGMDAHNPRHHPSTFHLFHLAVSQLDSL